MFSSNEIFILFPLSFLLVFLNPDSLIDFTLIPIAFLFFFSLSDVTVTLASDCPSPTAGATRRKCTRTGCSGAKCTRTGCSGAGEWRLQRLEGAMSPCERSRTRLPTWSSTTTCGKMKPRSGTWRQKHEMLEPRYSKRGSRTRSISKMVRPHSRPDESESIIQHKPQVMHMYTEVWEALL